MEKNRYEILLKNIPEVELVSLTGHTWYNYNHDIVPWTGTTGYTIYVGPNDGDIIRNIPLNSEHLKLYHNVTGETVTPGYYKWNDTGSTWTVIITGTTKIDNFDDYNILLSLENTIDEMGVMVGFDGNIEQVEQLCNFSYTGNTGSTIVTVYNTVNPEVLRTIVDQNFTISWGDGSTSGITATPFSTVSHEYTVTGDTESFDISIQLDSTWTTQKLTKTVTLPFIDYNFIDDQFQTTIVTPSTGSTFPQEYLTDLDYTTTGTTYSTTGYTGFTYVAFGESRIDEKILYGQSAPDPTQITTGITENLTWSGYTIDDFYYRDFSDGYTMITGRTDIVTKEEVPFYCLTRNEHFIGFVDEPTIYSDIFVDRGKQGVMEKSLRLSEIDNIGELEIYGNGYFNIRKQ